MIDASGTNKFTWTAGDQLLTEDGPFAADTVTNAYANRLRTAWLWVSHLAPGPMALVTMPPGD